MKNARSLYVNTTSKIVVFSLIAISVVSLVGNMTTSILIKDLQSDAAKVNLAGIQRALSQQALVFALTHQKDGDKASLEALYAVVKTFKSNQKDLLLNESGDGEEVLSPAAEKKLKEISYEIEGYFQALIQSASTVGGVLPSSSEAERVLGLLNDVVELEERASRERLDEVLNQGVLFSILSVVVTLLLGFLLLRFRISKDHREKLSLHRLSRKFINVFEDSPVIQYALDEDCRIVDLNVAGEKAFRYSREKIIGKSILDFVSIEDGSDIEWWKSLGKVTSEGKCSVKMSFTRPSGASLPVRLYISRVADREDNGPAYNVIAIDQREAEEARARADRNLKRYEDGFRFSPLPLFSAVATGDIVRANPAFLNLCKASSLSELNGFEFTHIVSVAAKRLLRKNGPQVIVHKQTLFDIEGGSRDVILSMRLSGEVGEEINYIEGALSDITELEVVKREVQASRARFRDLYDETPVMQCSLNARFKVSDTNRFLCSRLEATYADLRDEPFVDLLAEQSAESFIERLTAAVKVGDTLTMEVDVKSPDGGALRTRVFARPVYSRAGPLQKVFVTLLDLSALAEAEKERDDIVEKLRTAEKLEAVGQLAAGIAHEINTPCQYVSDNLTFLNEAFEDIMPLISAPEVEKTNNDDVDLEFYKEELPGAISQSIHGMTQITKIVRAMKDFSHPGTDSKENVDFNRLVESVTTVARNEWKYTANLELNLDPLVGQVPCAGSAINQVVLNMVVNAAHAMEEKYSDGGMGNIKISTVRHPDHIEMQIKDNGGGIAPELLNQIYNPFFTTKEVGKGTGQGLAIAHRIITEEHGGSLEVKSTVGEGTCFTICLPLHPVENAA